jgi:diguanylate cyclase (GGDEF)-like protein
MTTPHHTISILLFDLDHFKKINDTYGHLGGDNVLKAVGNLLSSGTRAEDLAARLGGEELAVVLYGVNEAQGKQIAERFRAQIAAIQLIDPKGVISPTTSIGGITITGPLSHEQASDSNFLRSLLHKGDQSLYEAKQNGRNRVVWAKTEQQGFWSMFSRR